MEEKEIVENNKLIAEFLGLTKTNVDGCWGTCEYLENNPDSTLFCSVPFTEELYFNRSWDWLMPVVEKIESLDFVFQLQQTDVVIFDYTKKELDGTGKNIILSVLFKNTKLESTYLAVVEFIKYYNGREDISRS